MKRINSRQKGKRGELTVAKLLTKATGCEWRRTAQVRGKNDGAPDIESPAHPNLWVEVKDRAGWYVGCTPWLDAWQQCRNEADEAGKVPVLIWRCARGKFAATVGIVNGHGLQAVTYSDIGWAVAHAEELAIGVVIP